MKKKETGFPDWLLSAEQSFPGDGASFCQWLCSGCGAPYYFRKRDGKHGRPSPDPATGYTPIPLISRRLEYVGFVGPCWRSRPYGVKCVTPRGGRVLYHEGYPEPTAELITEVTRVASMQRKEQQKLDKRIRASIVIE